MGRSLRAPDAVEIEWPAELSTSARLVGKGVALRPLPPRCRDGVDSPYLPACVFHAPGAPRE